MIVNPLWLPDIYLFILFISLIHQQSYQTVAAKGIQHADGKARPTGTYSFPDKTKHKNEHLQSTDYYYRKIR